MRYSTRQKDLSCESAGLTTLWGGSLADRRHERMLRISAPAIAGRLRFVREEVQNLEDADVGDLLPEDLTILEGIIAELQGDVGRLRRKFSAGK